jgi:hypothetical protein
VEFLLVPVFFSGVTLFGSLLLAGRSKNDSEPVPNWRDLTRSEPVSSAPLELSQNVEALQLLLTKIDHSETDTVHQGSQAAA